MNYRLGFSGLVLPGSVHLHRNVALECRVIGGKRDAIFPIGSSCARLAAIFGKPEVELNYRLGFSGLVLPGNVHLHRNVALECHVIGGKRDAIFPIGLGCARLAPFLYIPEVEFRYRLRFYGRFLSGNIHLH